MVKSLKELSLEIVTKDPLRRMDTWRATRHPYVTLTEKPEPLDWYVARKLRVVQLAWRIQGKSGFSIQWFQNEYKVDPRSPSILTAKFIFHFRKIQLWNSVFKHNHRK